VLRLSSTPVVSIAKIRGRTRGIGNESSVKNRASVEASGERRRVK
jgi:hypothetical protein